MAVNRISSYLCFMFLPRGIGAVSVVACAFYIPPVTASLIWMTQLAKRWEQTGIQESQPLVRRSLHIIPRHMTTAALSQHRGWVVAALCYVMTRRRGGWQWREGFYWDVSECIIVHRANRLPVTCYGWGLLLTHLNISAWLAGGAFWWGLMA